MNFTLWLLSFSAISAGIGKTGHSRATQSSACCTKCFMECRWNRAGALKLSSCSLRKKFLVIQEKSLRGDGMWGLRGLLCTILDDVGLEGCSASQWHEDWGQPLICISGNSLCLLICSFEAASSLRWRWTHYAMNFQKCIFEMTPTGKEFLRDLHISVWCLGLVNNAKRSYFYCSWWYHNPAVVVKGCSARGCFSAVPICFTARQLNLTRFVCPGQESHCPIFWETGWWAWGKAAVRICAAEPDFCYCNGTEQKLESSCWITFFFWLHGVVS